jgi:hypothetical protein
MRPTRSAASIWRVEVNGERVNARDDGDGVKLKITALQDSERVLADSA